MQYQTAAAECGLACLAMILNYHGKRVDLPALRQVWPISMKGMTFTQLVEVAGELGLSARPLRLDLGELKELRTPCILHWRLDHFVVLERANSRCAIIFDPACGRKKLATAEASRLFSGAALELAPSADFSRSPVRSELSLRRFFENSNGLGRALLQLFGLSCALQTFALVTPFYTQMVIDDIVLSGDVDLLLLAAMAFAAVAGFSAITSGFRSWVIIYTSSILNFSWSSGLFDHLIQLPYDYFEKHHIGDIQSRFGSLNALRDLLTTQVVEAVIDGTMAVTTTIVMYLYSPKLTAVVLSSVALYAVIQSAMYGPLRAASLEAIVRTAVRDTFFLETVRGVLAIKNFGNESSRKIGYENRVADGISANVDVGRIRIWGEVSTAVIFGVQNVLLVWFAARGIIAGQFTVGMMVAFLAYKVHFVGRSAGLVDKVLQFRLARIHLDRLNDIVAADKEQLSGPKLTAKLSPGQPLSGRIEARDIRYRYGPNEPYVIDGRSLSIGPGEHVAITGPSGCGKSTLLKLLVGLSTPDKGSILIDGTRLETLGLRCYRQQIGVVLQNDFLLGGTLLDNIAFFCASPDMDKAEECCRIAGIHDEIIAMPMGYYTLVGDMGDVLSGGQKQRIVLARALYRDPKILFLDEATSHLDSCHESHIVSEISALVITRVVIAHRQETIRHADRIIDLAQH